MLKDLYEIKEEEKLTKRIGIASWLDAKILESIPNLEEWFDLNKHTQKERLAYFDTIPGLVQKQSAYENITPTAGFVPITKGLAGGLGSVAEITVNYHAMGTGTNAPAAGDTQLQTEGVRKLMTSKTWANNKFYATIFYTAAEAVGTWEEIEMVINGTASANTGVCYDRSLLHIVKSAVQALTIDYEDTYING